MLMAKRSSIDIRSCSKTRRARPSSRITHAGATALKLTQKDRARLEAEGRRPIDGAFVAPAGPAGGGTGSSNAKQSHEGGLDRAPGNPIATTCQPASVKRSP